jgi:hyperosmotically inducible protein
MGHPEFLKRAVLASAVLCAPVVSAAALRQTAPADAQIHAQIERRIRDLKLGSSQVTVAVHDRVVTLDGIVPTLWLKRQLIEFARKEKGIEEVQSTLEIARAENDEKLAAEVGKRLRGYTRYTIYDFVDGRVRDGIVTLNGAVTMDLKQAEIDELIEKIPGVRDLKDGVTVLPLSSSDDRIRASLGNQIYRSALSASYSQVNPPVRVIVEHGHVTLIGTVVSQVERQKAEVAARMMPGVFTVDNRIQLASEQRGK